MQDTRDARNTRMADRYWKTVGTPDGVGNEIYQRCWLPRSLGGPDLSHKSYFTLSSIDAWFVTFILRWQPREYTL